MNLNTEQVQSLNRFTTSFVAGNPYLSKSVNRYNKLIVCNPGNQLIFDLDEFGETYQKKFIVNNLDLYCTSLFIAVKPIIVTFLKNEGMTGSKFNCLFLFADRKVERVEAINVGFPR